MLTLILTAQNLTPGTHLVPDGRGGFVVEQAPVDDAVLLGVFLAMAMVALAVFAEWAHRAYLDWRKDGRRWRPAAKPWAATVEPHEPTYVLGEAVEYTGEPVYAPTGPLLGAGFREATVRPERARCGVVKAVSRSTPRRYRVFWADGAISEEPGTNLKRSLKAR